MASKIFIGLFVSAILYFLFGQGAYKPTGYPELQKATNYDHLIKERNFEKNLKLISHPNLQFPEDLLVQDGFIYAGGYQGKVYKIEPYHQIFTVIVQTKGQIMRIIKQQNIYYFLDVQTGICKYNADTEKLEVLIKSEDYGFLDSFDLSKDGKIYFTDATSKYNITNFFHDILEGIPHGKLYSYDLQTKKVKVLIEDLHFANGVELSPDQSIVYVSETTRFRVWKYHLKGKKAGQKEILIENLPGSPDNIRFNDNGQLWIALAQERSYLTQTMLKGTFLRKLLSKLPYSWIEKLMFGANRSGGLKVDEKGNALEYFLVQSNVFSVITTVVQKRNTLYLGSVHHTDIGIFDNYS